MRRPGKGAGRAQQLEQRALAEQIEIDGVKVLRLEKLLASGALTSPSVLQPALGPSVVGEPPVLPLDAPRQKYVQHHQAKKEHHGGDQRQTHATAAVGPLPARPRQKHTSQKNQSSQVAQQPVAAAQSTESCLGRLRPLAVELSRRFDHVIPENRQQ